MTGREGGTIRLLRLLLHAFPRRHRERFGDEMIELAAVLAGEARRTGGRRGAAVQWTRSCVSVVTHGLVMRSRDRRVPQHRTMTFGSSARSSRMETLLNDCRYALRSLRHQRGLAVTIVITLALGIGANAALFSIVNTVLLQPLPYRSADRLAIVWHDNVKDGKPKEPVSYDTWRDVEREARTIDAAGIVSPVWDFSIRTEDGVQRVTGQWMSASLFTMLGVAPVLGRTFTAEEDSAEGPSVVLVSERLWRRLLGARPDLHDASLVIDGQPVAVVGVMPADFHVLTPVDVFAPATRNPVVPTGHRRVRLFTMLVRLREGVAIAEAQAEMSSLAHGIALANPDTNTGLGARIVALREEIVAEARPALLALFGAVGFVLLIACANIANLLLTRTLARQREMAVRAALGASRGRLARQVIVEGLCLATAGAALGLALAQLSITAMRRLDESPIPRHDELSVDLTVLLFCALVAGVTGVLVALIPGLQASRVALTETLKESGRAVTAAGRSLRRGLVLAEVALAVMLLTGAGLLLRSFLTLTSTDPGFSVDRILTLQLDPSPAYDESAKRGQFYEALFDSLATLPGVDAAGGVTRIPLGKLGGVTTKIEIEGRPQTEGEKSEIEFRRASPTYFPAMGIPLARGRLFTRDDVAGRPAVAIVNEAAARRFWPGVDAVGKRLRPTGADDFWTIVGVVGDIHHFGLDKPVEPEVYMPFLQGPPNSPLVAVRTQADPASIVAAVRARIRSLDPDAVVWNEAPMRTLVSTSVSRPRLNVVLMTSFAALALVVAIIGLYGVLTHLMAQRTAELGLRVALGATARDVFALVLGQGLRVTVLGLGIGLAGALLVSRLISSLLYRTSPFDPLTFAAVAVTFLLVATVACAVPARRAMRVDPVTALRGS